MIHLSSLALKLQTEVEHYTVNVISHDTLHLQTFFHSITRVVSVQLDTVAHSVSFVSLFSDISAAGWLAHEMVS